MFQSMCQLGSLTLQAACSLSSPRGTTPAYPQPKRSSFSYPQSCTTQGNICKSLHRVNITYSITLKNYAILYQYVSVYQRQVVSCQKWHAKKDSVICFILLYDIDQCFRDLFNFGPLPPHLGQKSSKRDVQLTNLHVIYTKKVHASIQCIYSDSARVQGYWECYIDTGSLRRTWRRKQVRRAATLVMRLMTKQSTKIRNSSSFINFNTVFFRIGRSSVLFTLHRGLDLPIRTVIKQTGKMWT